MAQRRKQALPKKRSRSPREAVETLRRALDRERAVRKHALAREKEAFEQQAATADILRVISSSPTSVQPVFEAIVARATDLCEAHFGALFLVSGEVWRMVSHRGASAEAQEVYRSFRAGPTTGLGRMTRERKPVHIEDLLADAATAQRDPLRMATIEKLGARTFLAVPLLKESAMIGGVVIYRKEVRAFGESQIRLLTTFADQAVIAMENVRLFNETKEALERQTATGEILASMSGSMTDTRPVFEAIVRSLLRLFGTSYAVVALRRGEVFELAGFQGEPGFEHLREHYPVPVDEHTILGEAVIARQVKRYAPIAGNLAVPRLTAQIAQRFRFNSALAAPMMWKGEAIGVIMTARTQALPFDDTQVALIQSFAAQAVIAIENVRLFNETKEALERQTATSEVLKTISRSTFDLNAVLQVLIENATRLAGANQGFIFRFDGQRARLAYSYNAPPAYRDLIEANPIPPMRGSAVGRVLLECKPVHIADALADPEFTFHEAQRAGGFRSMLGVPMVREGSLIGVIAMWSTEVKPFTEKQMELVSTFADQAVIAIENVRLFNETKEALDQQKASAEVLAVISSSIADTKPVFEKILESCERIFAGRNVGINIVGDDGKLHIGAYKGQGRVGLEAYFPLPLSMESASGTAILQRQVVHYPDCDAPGVPEYARRGAHTVGIKSMLQAPMLWEGKGVGVIFVGRPVTGPFSEKEIALLRTFADQAVIAIQNARLVREIQEKSAQLEVANKHKSDFLANMSHELRTPLNAIIGFSEAMMDKLFGELNEKQSEYLKDIHESGKHLLSLINDILDLSKIEAGKMELELSTFHLPTAVSNAVTLVRERAMRHGVALNVDIDERLGEFQADERKLKQVLLNLLSNAVKFTPDGGRVEVSAKLDTDKVQIAVKDTGVGIAPADQASLFEEFKQLGKDSSRKAEGTGLGLALTKRLVELHGGQILVDSAVGKGSTFRVLLPVSPTG